MDFGASETDRARLEEACAAADSGRLESTFPGSLSDVCTTARLRHRDIIKDLERLSPTMTKVVVGRAWLSGPDSAAASPNEFLAVVDEVETAFKDVTREIFNEALGDDA